MNLSKTCKHLGSFLSHCTCLLPLVSFFVIDFVFFGDLIYAALLWIEATSICFWGVFMLLFAFVFADVEPFLWHICYLISESKFL